MNAKSKFENEYDDVDFQESSQPKTKPDKLENKELDTEKPKLEAVKVFSQNQQEKEQEQEPVLLTFKSNDDVLENIDLKKANPKSSNPAISFGQTQIQSQTNFSTTSFSSKTKLNDTMTYEKSFLTTIDSNEGETILNPTTFNTENDEYESMTVTVRADAAQPTACLDNSITCTSF
jgi:hypothetical protein